VLNRACPEGIVLFGHFYPARFSWFSSVVMAAIFDDKNKIYWFLLFVIQRGRQGLVELIEFN